MSYLSKEAFLSVRDKQCFDIELPNDKGKVRARKLSAADQAAALEMAKQSENSVYQLAIFPLFALVDEHGNRMFEAGDLSKLMESLDMQTLVHIANAIGDAFTGAGGSEEVKGKAKNSETVTTDSGAALSSDSAESLECSTPTS